MDCETLEVYRRQSEWFVQRFELAESSIDLFSLAFANCSRVLDVGCASGRDLRLIQSLGIFADGVDPCQEFVDHTASLNKQLGAKVFCDSLPHLNSVADKSYDGLLCSAVLMHLPEEELFDAIFSIRRVLKDKGRVLLSIPALDKTIDVVTKRDELGRLFNGVSPDQLELLFERIGFRLIQRSVSKDALNREHRSWVNLLFELEYETGSRPIDTIESVLNKDNKVATYKLALFRSLAEIAITNYKIVQWNDAGRVKVPLSALAEKWLEYYWPIIESEIRIPQTTGQPIAFRSQLEGLVDYYRSRGGLSAYCLAYRNKSLSSEALSLSNKLLSKLKQTIWTQPVKFAGGGKPFSVFAYDKQDKTVLLSSDIWKELSLMGTWIQDATILRWAELTSKISKGEIKASTVIDCLLTSPVNEREVGAAQSFYKNLSNKVCVWSDKQIKDKFDLDHAIPFSLWKNNDLWNLLPTDSKVNSHKSDRLPSRELTIRRQDCILDYWAKIKEEFPIRFEYEAEKLMGSRFDAHNWEKRLFSSFAESIEITAVQRGVERWDLPCSANVFIDSKKESTKQVNVAKNNIEDRIIEFPSREEQFKSCIPFYSFAATAGAFDMPQYIEGEDLSSHVNWLQVDDMLITSELFAIKVVGRSMEPKIRDGEICIFRRGSALVGSREGKIVLVKHRHILDAETGSQFTVKKYTSERVYDKDNIPRHSKITLLPLNPEFEPIVIDGVTEEDEFVVIGVYTASL